MGSEQNTMGSEQVKKSRRNMLILLSVFIIPVILAKLALEQQWFNYGVTNKGQLISGEITLTEMGLNSQDFDHHWLMIYLLPEQCDTLCEQTLLGVNNTYIALGKEMPRVKPVALTHQAFTDEQLAKIQVKKWHIQAMPAQTKLLFKDTRVLIADPLGNVMLKHIPPSNVEQLPSFGKAILADFKKLLKYSKIG